MRIRYGKPIKVKSLLGNQFSSLTGDAFSTATTVIMFQNEHYYYGWKWNSFKYNFTLPSHKYFFYTKFKNNLTIRHNISIGTQNDGSISTYDYYNPSSIVISNERYTIFDNTNSAISRLDNIWFYYNSSYSSEKFNSDIDIPEYWILVDLTDIFGNGKEPTRQEFYNKYNKYFPLIAIGEEITIDRKVGQLPISRLPLDYQEVEYIESTGTQYIDTGMSISSTDASFMSKLKFSVSSFTDGDQVILGNTYQDNCMYWLPQFGGTTLRMFSRGNGSGNIVYGPNLITNTIYNINSYTSETLQKLVIEHNVYSKTTNLTMMDSQNLYLFANNYKNTTVTAYSAIKLYKAQLYKSEQLVRDFIPCYRKSDNEIGLYDLVGKQFYVNQGTGAFLKGPNVNNTISCKVAGGSSNIYYGYNQMIYDGHFASDGWDNFNTTYSSMSLVDNVLTLTAKDVAIAHDYDIAFKKAYQKPFAGLIAGHKYLVCLDILYSNSGHYLSLWLGNNVTTYGAYNTEVPAGSWVKLRNIITAYNTSTDAQKYTLVTVNSTGGQNYNGQTFKFKNFMLFDLTEMYGAGNEPTTVEEFKEKFIKDYYGFCPTPIKLTRYQIEALPNYGYNQLSPLWTTDTYNGVTASIKNNGKDIELSGTATGWYTKDKNLGQTIPSGHKVLVMAEMTNPTGANFGYRLKYNSDTPIYSNKEFNKIHTLTGDINKFQLYTDLGDNCTGIKLNNLVIIDLTDWYGEGNEPITIEEFKQTFPNKYYPYSKKRLLNKYMINKLEK